MQSVNVQSLWQQCCRWLFRIAFSLVLMFSFTVYAQAQQTVSGRTLDESGVELPGVSVRVKGTNTGAVSDFDGNYSIQVPDANAVLVFSYVGFKTVEINVGGRSSVDVTLEEDLQQLDEVVVVGYGTQRKEAVTGSVASVKGGEIREMPAPNISQAIQGRVAGVEMTPTSSKPGASMQIRIRGTRSLNASNDPLVVLDGIPFGGSIGDINPNDIKSLDILKDASATAIYGSRGANGVILVTTNRGQAGQDAKITYNGYTGIRTLFSKFPMMDGPEFVALRAAAGQFDNTLDESDDTNTDWQDMIFKTGMLTSHDIGVTGGTQKGSYSFNVGYYKDEAVVPLQNYERLSLRGSFDQGIGEFIRVGLTTNNTYAVTNGNNSPAVGMALGRSPIANPYNEDGSLKNTLLEQTSGAQWVPGRKRFESLGDKYVDQNRAFSSYNSLYAELDIPYVEGLKYRMNLGLNYRQSNDGSYTGEGVFSGITDNPSTASIANAHTTEWTIEHMLTYDRTFAEKHNLNVVALYSAQESRYNRSYVWARDIPADHFQFYNLGQAQGEINVNPGEQWYNVSGLMSYMGRAMYSYDDRYMLSATFRSDGSSRLAKGHQWHSYPAISAGWNIAKESFMKNVESIDQLKFRVGFGQTSNQSVDPYKTLGLLATRPYNFGDEFAMGYYLSELPNADLGWEYSETWNFGLDFSFFNNRLSGTAEYYIQNTNDVLLGVGLPPTTGVGSYTANIGKTQNKGMEFSLNGLILDNPDGLSWEAGINVYANRNKLVALASGQQRDEGNWWFVGHPIDVIYDYERTGLWQEDDPYRDILEPGGNAGMIKVKYTGDYNADGSPTRAIGAEDRQIRDLQPRFQGGFNTRLTYKNFDFSMVGAFKSGGTLISALYGSSGYLNTLNGRAGNNVSVDYWTPENTDAKYPKPGGIQTSDNPKYGSTLGYFDASFLKVRTITLGYNFDQKFITDAGIDRLRLYCTVQNPFVLFSPYTRESGMDPETNSYGDENVAVGGQRRLLIIGTNTPATRNYMIGLNLTF
ncbi:TonB-linked outer membrane protein, SusC/RagA family [Sinomicrobium oceani]|uniref:TonB-linked outer membrane protein, SusC/RagA family n=1 Tax=Sinomicrobium oceani TaxID=1150368 RepID=A0A1K1RHR9_9FLAO|nr:TonB-dependent receptor [Sinomicrobium oceani]SFW71396.1 TonB-linked outer membrane protein, SusC/RagA family [Sinomicrobium oceani]